MGRGQVSRVTVGLRSREVRHDPYRRAHGGVDSLSAGSCSLFSCPGGARPTELLFCERRAKSEQSVPPDRQSEHMRDRWPLVVVLILLLAITVIGIISTTSGGPSRSPDSSLETVVVPGVHSVGVAVSMQGHAECVRVVDRLV
jgi:hypothetical protein